MKPKKIFIGLMGDENKEYKLFERFKMALFGNHLDNLNDDEKNENKKLNIAETLTAVNGETCPSEIVFIAAFKHLYNSARKHLMKITEENIEDDEIQWIITVPAIWSDNAKHKMKHWAIKAGLVKNDIKNQCKIVYESDCASLAIQKEIFKHKQSQQYDKIHTVVDEKIDAEDDLSNLLRANKLYDLYQILIDNEMDLAMLKTLQKTETDEFCQECGFSLKQKLKFRKLIAVIHNEKQLIASNVDNVVEHKQQFDENTFTKGEKYILVDAGGGTVDVSCHELINEFGVKEIHHSTGGKWGSCYLDDQYMQKLDEIFTKDWMDEFKNVQPNIYIEIVENFQKAKSTFYENSEAERHECELPDDFIGFLEEKCKQQNCTPEQKVEHTGKNRDIVLYDAYLDIHVDVWKELFDSMIDKIISHIESLLQLKSLNGCKYLCLSGGFSCSRYFQFKMEEAFGMKTVYELTLIIPETPILSVVKGAAYLGVTKNYVKCRKLKRTYGIEMISSIDCGLVAEFQIVARKNQEIKIEDTIRICASATGGTGHSFTIPVLCSDKIEPKLAADGYKVAEINLPVFVDDKVVIEFHFYDTTIGVFCYGINNPNNKKHVEFVNYKCF